MALTYSVQGPSQGEDNKVANLVHQPGTKTAGTSIAFHLLTHCPLRWCNIPYSSVCQDWLRLHDAPACSSWMT